MIRYFLFLIVTMTAASSVGYAQERPSNSGHVDRTRFGCAVEYTTTMRSWNA
jgi:hypothetical protein